MVCDSHSRRIYTTEMSKRCKSAWGCLFSLLTKRRATWVMQTGRTLDCGSSHPILHTRPLVFWEPSPVQEWYARCTSLMKCVSTWLPLVLPGTHQLTCKHRTASRSQQRPPVSDGSERSAESDVIRVYSCPNFAIRLSVIELQKQWILQEIGSHIEVIE